MTSPTLRLALKLKGPLEEGEAGLSREQRADRLRRSTESVITLPTLPASIERLLEMVGRPETSARSLASVISMDQVLTARLLRLANSSYYGFSQKVSTVSLALVMLGFDAAKDIALTTTVMRSFGANKNDPRFDLSRFWSHAVSVASASRYLSRVLRIGSPGEAFTAGILHDIGQVVLHAYHPEAFGRVLQKVLEEGAPLLETELDILGATHPQVGGWLCRRWNLPEAICASVEHHHAPQENTSGGGLPGVVAMADHFDGIAPEGGWLGGNGLDKLAGILAALTRDGVLVEVDDMESLAKDVRLEIEKSKELQDAFR